MKQENCPDCGVKPGEKHLDNCDVERCSVCGFQYLMCSCQKHDKSCARWIGFWPGELEAKALGISLNKLYESGIYKTIFIKPTIGEKMTAKEREKLNKIIDKLERYEHKLFMLKSTINQEDDSFYSLETAADKLSNCLYFLRESK
jgi:hypothetical protein